MNDSKFDNLVLYISKKVSRVQLGSIKLNKTLYYSDMSAYMKTGESITGSAYLKRQHGPVPKLILESLNRLESGNHLRIREVLKFGNLSREYIPLSEPNMSDFTVEELLTIDAVAKDIAENHTAASISEESHTDIWEMATIGEDLPNCTFLVNSLGEINESDVDWAIKVLNKKSVAYSI